jgi:hypothetical protein
MNHCQKSTYTLTVLTYLLTYSMKQSPSWEANWFAASQEIPHILLNPKVRYLIHKCPPPVSILSQPNPVHTPHPTSWRSILILLCHLHLGLPSGLFPSGFTTKTLYTPLYSPIYVTCPTHFILLDFITCTILGEEYRSWSSSLWSFLHSPFTSSLSLTVLLYSFMFGCSAVKHMPCEKNLKKVLHLAANWWWQFGCYFFGLSFYFIIAKPISSEYVYLPVV